jgi:hypothetical protein
LRGCLSRRTRPFDRLTRAQWGGDKGSSSAPCSSSNLVKRTLRSTQPNSPTNSSKSWEIAVAPEYFAAAEPERHLSGTLFRADADCRQCQLLGSQILRGNTLTQPYPTLRPARPRSRRAAPHSRLSGRAESRWTHRMTFEEAAVRGRTKGQICDESPGRSNQGILRRRTLSLIEAAILILHALPNGRLRTP